MRKETKLKLALIAITVFVSIQIVLALQVPNFGDYDNDGDRDIVMTEIIQNQGNHTFYEMNEYYNIEPITATYGFFINVNGDSYLDVYLVYSNTSNKLLVYNNTNANFTDITSISGIGGNASSPIGANTADFDDDGNADIFVDSKLFLGQGNGSFTDVTNESNLAELPRLKAIVPWDFNEDNLTDIIGLNETGEEVILMLNMDDNNGDNIPEFWDASIISQLTDLTKADLASSIANSIAVGWQWNYTHNETNITYLISGLYLPRNGQDILLDTSLSSKFSTYTFTGIPEFKWINISSSFIGNTTAIMQNSTDAVFVDLDNNTVDDLLISGSATCCFSYGDNVVYTTSKNCSMMPINDPFGEGWDQSTTINYISGIDPSAGSPDVLAKSGSRSIKGTETISKQGSIQRIPGAGGEDAWTGD